VVKVEEMEAASRYVQDAIRPFALVMQQLKSGGDVTKAPDWHKLSPAQKALIQSTDFMESATSFVQLLTMDFDGSPEQAQALTTISSMTPDKLKELIKQLAEAPGSIAEKFE
jgi:hypothetical protein